MKITKLEIQSKLVVMKNKAINRLSRKSKNGDNLNEKDTYSSFASSSGPGPTSSLPLPPLSPGEASKQAKINSFLNSLEGKFEEGLQKFSQGIHISFPEIPHELLTEQRKAFGGSNQLKEMRARLITGYTGCGGTTEVANWIANCLKKDYIHLRPSVKTILMDVLGNESQVSKVAESLGKLVPTLQYLHLVREHTHFFRFNFAGAIPKLTPEIPTKWENYASMCALSVLSSLRHKDEMILPMDFIYFVPGKDEKSIPVAHATTLVIKKKENNVLEFSHFESNGHNRTSVKHTAIAKKRLSGRGLQDRAKSFNVSDFKTDEATFEKFETGRDGKIFKSKTFTRVTNSFTFNSLKGNAAEEDIRGDLNYIRDLLFQETTKISDNLSESYDTQQAVLGAGYFIPEPQRLYAVQGTNSCELKSATIASGFLIDDELAYQSMMLILVNRAETEFKGTGSKEEEKLLRVLQADLTHVTQRIEDHLLINKEKALT